MIYESLSTLEYIESQRLNAVMARLFSKNYTKHEFFREWNALNMQGNTYGTSRGFENL